MFEFILHGSNLPFTVALVLMLGITLLEGAGSILGFGVSEYLDTLLPDADFDAPEFETASIFTRALGWLRIGKVPALMLLILFLTAFGLIGLCFQFMADSIIGATLPAAVAVVPAFFASLPVVRVFGGGLARILPRDETDAVSEKSFIGRVATITLGKAAAGSPAQAKLRDQHGTTHYIMVEPDMAGEVFETGASVLIVSQRGSVFRAIRNLNPVLSD